MEEDSEEGEISDKEVEKEAEFVDNDELNFEEIDVNDENGPPKYEFEDDDDDGDRLNKIINETRAKVAASFNNPEGYKDEIFGIEYQDEHLTDSFHETKWKPPSTGRLMLYHLSIYY